MKSEYIEPIDIDALQGLVRPRAHVRGLSHKFIAKIEFPSHLPGPPPFARRAMPWIVYQLCALREADAVQSGLENLGRELEDAGLVLERHFNGQALRVVGWHPTHELPPSHPMRKARDERLWKEREAMDAARAPAPDAKREGALARHKASYGARAA